MWHRMDFILCHIQFSLHHTLFTFTWIPTRKHTTVTTLLSTQFVVLLSPFIATHQFGFLWQCRAHTLNEHLIYSPSLHISLSTKYSRASPPHIWIPTIHHIMLAVRVSTSLPICWRSMAQTYFEWMQLNSSSSRISRITRVSAQNSPRLCPLQSHADKISFISLHHLSYILHWMAHSCHKQSSLHCTLFHPSKEYQHSNSPHVCTSHNSSY